MFWVVLGRNDVLLVGEPLDGDVPGAQVDVLHGAAQVERSFVISDCQTFVPGKISRF